MHILFDKDGTITDLNHTWINWCNIVINYMIDCGYRLDEKTLLEKLGVLDDKEIATNSPLAVCSIEETEIIFAYVLYAELNVPWSLGMEVVKKAVSYANEQRKSHVVKPISGVIELIKMLKKQNYSLGLLTADDTNMAEIELAQLGVKEDFDFIYGSDKVKHSKPASDLILYAKNKHQIDFNQCVMIGDSNADMVMAKSVGVPLKIGFTTDKNKLPDADYYINHYDLHVILDLIKKIERK